jgi:hypothetical protein
LPIDRARLIYLQLTSHRLGRPVDPNVPTLRNGIKRVVNNFSEPRLTVAVD